MNAQLKVATDGKVAIEGSVTNYGGLQINKDGYTNGIAFSQSDNYGSNPFRIFRNGLTGYIIMDNVTNQYSGFRMSQDGKIAMGGLPSCWSFMGQLAVYGNNFSAIQTRFYYPANNGGDGIS